MWDGIRNQLRSVIEWENPTADQLFYRWSNTGDEIKNASALIVNPGQGCIFVYEGRVRAMHVESGLTKLTTDNIPFWTTVKKFMQGFESEHKVGIYFFRMAKVLDQKWGTTSSIVYKDPVYQFPVGLKAYGNFSYRIRNPQLFFVNVVAGSHDYSTQDFRSVIASRLLQPISDYLAESKYSYAEIDANGNEISDALVTLFKPEFEKFGFEITDFRIEGTTFDQDTQSRISRIADVTAEVSSANIAGLDYEKFQRISALRDAANNEGAAGAGMGFMAGGNLAGQFSEQADSQKNDSQSFYATLTELKELRDADIISEEEFMAKKQDILSRI